MQAAGFTVGGDPDHPICPIMLGDARLASEFADEMLERGIFVIGFSYPVRGGEEGWQLGERHCNHKS